MTKVSITVTFPSYDWTPQQFMEIVKQFFPENEVRSTDSNKVQIFEVSKFDLLIEFQKWYYNSISQGVVIIGTA